MKIAIALLLLSAAILPADADDLAPRQALQRYAQHCGDALVKHDYAGFADCSTARMVQRAGGKARIAALIRGQVEQIVAEGVHKESTTYELPKEIHTAGAIQYAVIHGRSVMTGTVMQGPTAGKRGRFDYDDYELGISEDSGRSWKMGALSAGTLSLYPEVTGVAIPVPTKPRLLGWLPAEK